MHDPIHSNLKFDSIIDVGLSHGAYKIWERHRGRRPLHRKSFVLGLADWGLEREEFRINGLRLDPSALP
jgi:hypothetical protein